MTDVLTAGRNQVRAEGNVRFYGVHHLALNTDDMKMTVDFYVGVLGMRLVHAMKVPPGLGTGPKNRGSIWPQLFHGSRGWSVTISPSSSPVPRRRCG